MVFALQFGDGLLRIEERNAAAGHDTFFDGATRGVQGVVDQVLMLFHFDFAAAANFQHGNAADELGEALLNALLLIFRIFGIEHIAQLLASRIDAFLGAFAADNHGFDAAHLDPRGLPQMIEVKVFELVALVLIDQHAAGEYGDIIENGASAIAEQRCLYGDDVQAAAQLVHDQAAQRLALDILGDDQQRPARLHNFLQYAYHAGKVGDFLIVQKDIRVAQLGDHLLGIGHEIRRQKSLVETHTVDDLKLTVQRRAFLDGDNAFLTDLFHGGGNHFTDHLVAVGGNARDVGDLVMRRYRFGALGDIADGGANRLVDTALHIHGVHPGGDALHAFAQHCPRQKGCRGGAVSGHLAGADRHVADHLGAQILEPIG